MLLKKNDMSKCQKLHKLKKHFVKPECWQDGKPIRCRVSYAQAD